MKQKADVSALSGGEYLVDSGTFQLWMLQEVREYVNK